MEAGRGFTYLKPSLSNLGNQGESIKSGNNYPLSNQYGQPMSSYNPQQAVPMPTLVKTQPNVMVIPQPTYRDYLGLSIMNLILCCFPVGIAAVVFSCKTRDSLRRGDMISAASDSRTAFSLNMVALGLGIAANIVWVAYVIYVLLIIFIYSSSSHHDNVHNIYNGSSEFNGFNQLNGFTEINGY
ncbi:major prion -like [Pelobates cultripes]|uniref:Major prion -like n=1 Tax=Pelobates cultripes TaxID=61616 RepID=A0AAD1T3D9_PELCU|nr:major prion -like [Pelobates cultripes]